jgi:exopolyphosphatase / guanosine-5'-triphosphate,3'-diphosphate pyrophosphatase
MFEGTDLQGTLLPRLVVDGGVLPRRSERTGSIVMGHTPSMAAAVDLGSNSFHMVIARVEEHDLRIMDRIKEPVQLAGGFDGKKNLTEEAQGRALACLERFGQRLREMPPQYVRAVGTNTLRKAKNARDLLARARKALGHPIEVISGREEARLIYLGVSHTISDAPGRRLVVDIGGGSTECILGEGFDAIQADSLHMGCVGYSLRFFEGGKLRREAFREAQIAARLELQTIERRYRAFGWESCIGSSGTIEAIADILRAAGWSEPGVITKQGLRKLRKTMVAAGAVSKLELPTLSPNRAGVLPGGLAILLGAFESFGIESMKPCSGALREGVIYDLLGRIRHEDVRDRTIRRFVERYGVDLEQAARVERTAVYLLKQAAKPWQLDDPELRHLLEWAARLHEIGLAIAYTSYHKHGAYLIERSDMPGFSNDDQQALAALVRTHRRKTTRALFPEGIRYGVDAMQRLAALLRLAVLLNRSRSVRPLPTLALTASKDGLKLEFPAGWLDEHPLSRADLEEERPYMRPLGIDLAFA